MGAGASTQTTAKQELANARTNAARRGSQLGVAVRYHAEDGRLLEDDYEMTTKELGSGLNGSVYLAKSRATGEKFAVKPFQLWGITKTQKTQLRNEVEMVLSMDHPHVARVADVYEGQAELTLVMECLEGGELFDRITSLAKFSETDAADATRQMLLAIAYLHEQSIVHRDIKCENFLYDKKDGNFLKLIDFGFSRVHKSNKHMKMGCGTIAYMAPEVLGKSYTSKCDLWSMGVVVFILLMGYMPFGSGISEEEMAKRIKAGNYTKEESWNHLSSGAQAFVEALLVVNPDVRLSAQDALQHDWLESRCKSKQEGVVIDEAVLSSLCQFASASKFKRICMSAMAFSMSHEERAQVRQAFLEIDTDNTGTITLNELKSVLDKTITVSDSKVEDIFKTFESSSAGLEQVNYSDFLAAMMAHRLEMQNELLIETFRRFDTTGGGFITAADLKHLLGTEYSEKEVERLIAEADVSGDGRIDEKEFIEFMRGGNLTDGQQEIVDAALDIMQSDVVDGSNPRTPSARKVAEDKTKGAAINSNTSAASGPGSAQNKAGQVGSGEASTESAPAETSKKNSACVLL